MRDLVDAVPELARLTGARRDRVFSAIAGKLDKLSFKLRRSPYEPYRLDDPLHVNRDFPGAISAWLSQFPERVRLGALAVALGVTYVTHDELDALVDVAIARFFETLPSRGPASLPPPSVIRTLRPYPVSVFGVYDRFVHRVRVEGTKDRSSRPVHGLLDELTEHVVNVLRPLAVHGVAAPDHDAGVAALRQVVRSLTGAHVIVLEESAYSGYTIGAGLRRLVKLLDLLFAVAPLTPGLSPPRVSVVCLLATEAALDTMRRLTSATAGTCLPEPPIAACVIDRGQSFAHGIPDALGELAEALPRRPSLHARVMSALRFFHDEYGWRYLGEDTRLQHRYDGLADDFLFGFKKGGWAIVTKDNCPNNSVPLLWYPHGSSVERRIRPLFQRVESRVAHEARANQLDAAIQEIEHAGSSRIFPLLQRLFEDLHAAAA